VANEDVTVDGVAVTNDVSRRYFPTLGLGELVRNPLSRWVRSHSQPWDARSVGGEAMVRARQRYLVDLLSLCADHRRGMAGDSITSSTRIRFSVHTGVERRECVNP
jgi:hypothetical protein